ncbi:PREDICTED: uncharacterized protein LOC103595778 [Galeopterus variegatus]|uniref:Uncharacterized protein LOC103595778 n=1 Tax=Galeopterus variegatus TaxID=482537 RepID=A0ABM0RA35_GALVR|nr:PREDICTED: uncharacterized protein LOC103595778 [Galeopterus variegatus]
MKCWEGKEKETETGDTGKEWSGSQEAPFHNLDNWQEGKHPESESPAPECRGPIHDATLVGAAAALSSTRGNRGAQASAPWIRDLDSAPGTPSPAASDTARPSVHRGANVGDGGRLDQKTLRGRAADVPPPGLRPQSAGCESWRRPGWVALQEWARPPPPPGLPVLGSQPLGRQQSRAAEGRRGRGLARQEWESGYQPAGPRGDVSRLGADRSLGALRGLPPPELPGSTSFQKDPGPSPSSDPLEKGPEPSFLGAQTKPIDLITCHFALIHVVMLLTVNDFKCKVFFFMSRVMRDLSICTTCLLSMFQAITINHMRFKHKFANYITSIFFFLWFLSLSCSSDLVFCTVASSNVTQINLLNVNKYCSLFPMVSIIKQVFLTLTLFRDVSFVGIMMLSSAYMVILLFRHQRQSQYLHSTRLSLITSPVKRATQTNLPLVSFFVVIYWVDFIISSSSTLLGADDAVVVGIQRFVCNVFAIVSPLVIIRSDKRIIKTLQNMWQKHHHFLTS